MTQPARTAPTLAEVAAAAGVSRSTASRALNDSPRISARRPKNASARLPRKSILYPTHAAGHSPSDARKLSLYWLPSL
ncbi:MAG: LacI family DNA-binding transcriptional regulator [Collinsella sp.]